MPAKTPSATSLHNESKMCFTRTRKFHDEIRRFALTIWRSLNLYLVEIGQRRRSIRSACFHFPIVSCARNFEVVNRQTCSELTKDSVCVVGAGIIGLTTAYRIAEKNIPVHILARDTIYSATADPSVVKPYASSGAGGFWSVSLHLQNCSRFLSRPFISGRSSMQRLLRPVFALTCANCFTNAGGLFT